jgi:hypothetical protein
VKVIIDWDEQYPALFLYFDGEEYPDSSHPGWIEKFGTEVPDDLARRWRETRDAWRSLDDEVRKFTGRESLCSRQRCSGWIPGRCQGWRC